MWLGCEVCGESLMSKDAQWADRNIVSDGTCCKKCEHAYKYYKRLQDEHHNQYCRYHDLLDAVESLLSSTAEQLLSGKELVTCEATALQKIVELRRGKKDVKPFLGYLHLRLRIVADAVGLFIGRYQGRIGSETLYGRLKNLYESIVIYREGNEDKDWAIDQTHDSIIDTIKSGKENKRT